MHGLWRPTEAVETEQRYRKAEHRFRELGIDTTVGRDALLAVIAEVACEQLGIPEDHEQAGIVHYLVVALCDYDALFTLPAIDDWRARRTIAQWWDIRAELSRQLALVDDFDSTCDALAHTVAITMEPILTACPALTADSDEDGLHIRTSLLRSLGDVGVVTEAI